MRSTQRFSVLLLVLGVFSSSSSGQQGEPSDDDILSPSLQSLRTALSAGSQSALGEFWANVESRGTPLLEQVPNDSLHLFVTFLWRSKESFYLDVGRFEQDDGPTHWRANVHMRDVLVAKGYSVVFLEFSGGHSSVNWRGTVSDGLIALLRQHQR